MKATIFAIIVLTVILQSCKNEEVPALNEIVLSGQRYTPDSITVPLGTTLSWVNNDAVNYSVTSDSLFFDSGKMGKGNTFQYTFTKSGTYTYNSKYQPGMKGTVIVQSGTANRNVVIFGFGFTPATLSVTVGTVVKWVNNDPVAHTVTSDHSVFNSGNLNQGDTFSYTFNTTGIFPYHCIIHPSMTAVIVVQ
jgi:plastocyanin